MKISVMTPKGGVGKTSITLGLASVAARRYGKRPLIIEADPQKSVEFSMEAIDGVDYGYAPLENISELTGGEFPGFDVVIFDMPPYPGFQDEYLDLVRKTDFTVIPFFNDGKSLDSARYFVAPLTEREEEFDGKWSMLLNRGTTNHLAKPGEERVLDALREAGFPLLDAVLRERTVYSNLTNRAPFRLLHDTPDNKAKHEMDTLWREIRRRIAANGERSATKGDA